MNELSPELKKLLQTARKAYSPDDARVAAVRESLAARIAAPSGAESAATGSSSTGAAISSGIAPALRGGATFSTGAAWVKPIAGLLIAALGAGGLWLGARPAEPAPSPAPQRAPAPVAAPQPAAAAEAVVVAREAEVARETDIAREANAARGEEAAARRRAEPAAPRAHARAAAQRARPAPAVADTPAQAARDAAAAHPPAANDRHANGASTARPPAGARADSATQPTAPAGAAARERPTTQEQRAQPPDEAVTAVEPPAEPIDDPLVDELALLRRARAALARAQPSEALALAQQHASRFPRGTLRQERLATQVLALCGLQRTAEAQVLARELERVAHRSPHLMRLRASCVTPGGLGEGK